MPIERQTYRPIDRQAYQHAIRQTGRQTDGLIGGHTYIQTDIYIHRDILRDMPRDIQTNSATDRQTTDRRIDR